MMSKHLNVISCGQGAPSVYLIVMAGMGIFPCDAVIVADTGWENDMLWSTGERTDARAYFERVTKPLANKNGLEAFFVRAVDKNKKQLPDLHDAQITENGKLVNVRIPLFGSNGGRLKQKCTETWKIRAVRQQMRRMGATTATTALGLTMDEVHRVKKSHVKWDRTIWPMIESEYNHRTYRATITDKMNELKIPYLISTECDGCPHKNAARWLRTSEEKIKELSMFEAQFNGEYFLTKHLIPLNDAIDLMRNEPSVSLFDSCDSGYCFT